MLTWSDATWQSCKGPNSSSRKSSASSPCLWFLTPSWDWNWKLSWKLSLRLDSSVSNSLTVVPPSSSSPLGLYKNACCVLSSPQPNGGRTHESETTSHLLHRSVRSCVLCSRRELFMSPALFPPWNGVMASPLHRHYYAPRASNENI